MVTFPEWLDTEGGWIPWVVTSQGGRCRGWLGTYPGVLSLLDRRPCCGLGLPSCSKGYGLGALRGCVAFRRVVSLKVRVLRNRSVPNGTEQ